MTPELKKQWIDALRSGKYNQCQMQMRYGDRYCALGVLADIMDPEGWALISPDRYYHKDISPNGFELPPRYRYVVSMNDTGGSFEAIAEYLENVDNETV